MNFEAVFKIILDQWAKNHVRFALIGGFALHAAGYKRATHDIDFLVHHEDYSKVRAGLMLLGYEPMHESPEAANFWNRLSELGGIDFLLAHRKYSLAMLERARPFEVMPGISLKVAIPEDIIGLKIQALHNNPERKAQDMADIEWLIRNHKTTLNLELIREYFGLYNDEKELERILNAQ
jgi:hypothetical protein